MIKVGIIGQGNIGQAIKKILKLKSIEVAAWDKAHDKNEVYLSALAQDAKIIFLCVPSTSSRLVLAKVAKYINSGVAVISVAKGLERPDNKFIDEVMAEFISPNQVAVLYGPMLAAELNKGLKTAAILATQEDETFKEISDLFRDTNISLEYSSNVRGVAIAGVLKNIYAIGFGMIDALDLGNNFKGCYVQLAMAEMIKVSTILGGNDEAILGLAGLGDFIATGLSPHSRNRTMGEQLVRSSKLEFLSEGGIALPGLFELLGGQDKDLRLLNTLKRAVIDNQPAKNLFLELF